MIEINFEGMEDTAGTCWKARGDGEPSHLVTADDAQSNPQFFDVLQVARMFNRSARTVRWWIAQGRLKPVRVGRALFIPASEITRLMENV